MCSSKIAGIQPSRPALPPPNLACRICADVVKESALQCAQCSKYVHAACAGLPRYSILQYFTSRSAFSCEKCVEARHENLAELIKWMDTSITMRREQHGENIGKKLDDLKISIDDIKVQMKASVQPPTQHSYVETARNTCDVIVRPAGDQPVCRKSISNALNNVPVVNVTKTKQGAVKVRLPDHETAKSAANAINKIPQTKTLIPDKILPKLTIVAVSRDVEDDTITEAILKKNGKVETAVQKPQDLRLMFTRNTSDFSKTVVVSVSPRVREAVMYDGYLYIGDKRCRVYDRFWIPLYQVPTPWTQGKRLQVNSCALWLVCGGTLVIFMSIKR